MAASASVVSCPSGPRIARCFNETATLQTRRSVARFLHEQFGLYPGSTDCRGPGLLPGQPTYESSSYLTDSKMRDLEARLHYRLRYVCAWGSQQDPFVPSTVPGARFGRSLVVFTRVTKTRWVQSIRLYGAVCVPGDEQHPCP